MDGMIERSLPMLRISYALVTLPLALFQFGCAQPGRTGEDTSNVKPSMEVTPETKAPGNPGLYGTWTNERANVGRFNTLVLMTDGRYHSSRQVVCIKAPCLPIEENGTFELYIRDRARHIALVAEGSQDAQRYEYVSRTGLLQLRHILPSSTWYSMQHAAVAWCAEAKDCTMQALPPGPRAGGYTCNENQCAWQSGSGDEQAMK
jgi:hypothetical protein